MDTPTKTIRRADAFRIDSETVKITWEADSPGRNPVRIFSGPTPGQIDLTTAVARSMDGQAMVRTPRSVPGRPCFSLVPETGSPVTVAERRVPLQGCFNFRDLGGYPTENGRHVKWGAIFRSDAMARLTAPDHAALKSLGIRLVCDFRASSEAARSPDRLPSDGSVERLHLPVVHGDLDATEAFKRAAAGDLDWLSPDFMTRGYRNNIESFPRVWQSVFQRLADEDSRPLAFHCSAGKDRAGTCAALILSVLGVPEEIVVADHGLSNRYIGDILPEIHQRLRRRGIDPEPLAPYFQAPEAGIRALLDHLRENYGSAQGYLVRRCGVPEADLERIREELTDE